MPLFVAVLAASALTLAGGTPQEAAIVPDELLGPYALLVAALLVVGVLWRAYLGGQKAIIEGVTTRAVKAEGLLDVAVAGWRDQTGASAKSADAIEAIASQLEVRPARRR